MTTADKRREAYRAASEALAAESASDDVAVRRSAPLRSIQSKLRASPRGDANGRLYPDDDPPPGGAALPSAA